MRLFVAINIPEEQKHYLERLAQPFNQYGMRPTKPEQYHLTLRFIEDADPTLIDNALRTIQEEKFQLSFTHLGTFGNTGHPRVLWVGTTAHAAPLRAAVYSSLENIIGTDTRFTHHITLGRFTRAVPSSFYTQLQTPVKPYSFHVQSFQLIKSEETPKGLVHTTLHTYSLV